MKKTLARLCMDEQSAQKPSDWCTPANIKKANAEMMAAIRKRSIAAMKR